MKLMRLGARGHERPCVLDADGTARDVSGLVSDIGPDTLADLELRLSSADLSALPTLDMDGIRVGAPIARPRNVWCIGMNYSDHAAELGAPIPSEPIVFTKPGSAVCGPNDPVPLPEGATKLDWEVELGVVIGRPALNVSAADALSHVAGFCVVNDISERGWQFDLGGGQWAKGKGYPNFCPTGPMLVTRDEITDSGALEMTLSVNGHKMQAGSTATMIFDVAQIITDLSRYLLLEPGDLICTGTPPGVGMGKRPQRFLNDGDVMALEISGLGAQRQTVTRAATLSLM